MARNWILGVGEGYFSIYVMFSYKRITLYHTMILNHREILRYSWFTTVVIEL
jgi:hypothetical protein